jgi:hypothetical protein
MQTIRRICAQNGKINKSAERSVRSPALRHRRYHRRRRRHHHHHQHNQGLGPKTCSFKAQGVLGLSIFVSVFPYPAVPEVGTGKPASVGGFYPFVPDGLTI